MSNGDWEVAGVTIFDGRDGPGHWNVDGPTYRVRHCARNSSNG